MRTTFSIGAAAALMVLAGGTATAQNGATSNAGGAAAPPMANISAAPAAPAPTATGNEAVNATPATTGAPLPTAGDQAATPTPQRRPQPHGFPWGILGLVGLVGLWPLFKRRSDS
jgi:hypothetical protein